MSDKNYLDEEKDSISLASSDSLSSMASDLRPLLDEEDFEAPSAPRNSAVIDLSEDPVGDQIVEPSLEGPPRSSGAIRRHNIPGRSNSRPTRPFATTRVGVSDANQVAVPRPSQSRSAGPSRISAGESSNKAALPGPSNSKQKSMPEVSIPGPSSGPSVAGGSSSPVNMPSSSLQRRSYEQMEVASGQANDGELPYTSSEDIDSFTDGDRSM